MTDMSGLADIRERNAVRRRAERLLLERDMASVASQEDLAEFLAEVDKQAVLRETDVEELKRSVREAREDHELRRRYLVLTLVAQREHELEMLESQQQIELRKEDLLAEGELQAMRLDAHVAGKRSLAQLQSELDTLEAETEAKVKRIRSDADTEVEMNSIAVQRARDEANARRKQLKLEMQLEAARLRMDYGLGHPLGDRFAKWVAAVMNTTPATQSSANQTETAPEQSPKPQTSGRTTLLHQAVKSGNNSQVLILLKAGAAPDVFDEQGRTPLDYAAAVGNDSAVMLLLRYGASPDPHGQTASVPARGKQKVSPRRSTRSHSKTALLLLALVLSLGLVAIGLTMARPPTEYELGMRALDGDDLETAIDYLTRAIASDPTSDAYLHRGVARARQEDIEAAMLDYQSAIALDPEDLLSRYNLGIAYLEVGDYAAAIPQLTMAIELEPLYAPAWNARGAALRRTGDAAAALNDFNEAIRLDPWEAMAYRNRARAYSSLGQADLAAADEQRALEIEGAGGTLCEWRLLIPPGVVTRVETYDHRGDRSYDKRYANYIPFHNYSPGPLRIRLTWEDASVDQWRLVEVADGQAVDYESLPLWEQ